jgi:hypothetical protein
MATFPRRIENMIADLRGLPLDRNSSVKRIEKPMGEVMQQWLQKHLPESLLRLEEIIERRWPEIVGSALADYCQPYKIIQDHVLLVVVVNSIAQYALMLQKEVILVQLHNMPECRRIDQIRCCQR